MDIIWGTTALAETSASFELVAWLFDDGTVILFGEMAVPLQITPEIKKNVYDVIRSNLIANNV